MDLFLQIADEQTFNLKQDRFTGVFRLDDKGGPTFPLRPARQARSLVNWFGEASDINSEQFVTG